MQLCMHERVSSIGAQKSRTRVFVQPRRELKHEARSSIPLPQSRFRFPGNTGRHLVRTASDYGQARVPYRTNKSLSRIQFFRTFPPNREAIALNKPGSPEASVTCVYWYRNAIYGLIENWASKVIYCISVSYIYI